MRTMISELTNILCLLFKPHHSHQLIIYIIVQTTSLARISTSFTPMKFILTMKR